MLLMAPSQTRQLEFSTKSPSSMLAHAAGSLAAGSLLPISPLRLLSKFRVFDASRNFRRQKPRPMPCRDSRHPPLRLPQHTCHFSRRGHHGRSGCRDFCLFSGILLLNRKGCDKLADAAHTKYHITVKRKPIHQSRRIQMSRR